MEVQTTSTSRSEPDGETVTSPRAAAGDAVVPDDDAAAAAAGAASDVVTNAAPATGTREAGPLPVSSAAAGSTPSEGLETLKVSPDGQHQRSVAEWPAGTRTTLRTAPPAGTVASSASPSGPTRKASGRVPPVPMVSAQSSPEASAYSPPRKAGMNLSGTTALTAGRKPVEDSDILARVPGSTKVETTVQVMLKMAGARTMKTRRTTSG